MNHEKRRFLFTLAWFPVMYLGLALMETYVSIYVLDHYERKHGPWNSFKITMLIEFFFTLVTSVSYVIGTIERIETVVTGSLFRLFATALVSVCIVRVGFRILDGIEVAGNWAMVILLLWMFLLPAALAFTLFSTVPEQPLTHP